MPISEQTPIILCLIYVYYTYIYIYYNYISYIIYHVSYIIYHISYIIYFILYIIYYILYIQYIRTSRYPNIYSHETLGLQPHIFVDPRSAMVIHLVADVGSDGYPIQLPSGKLT